MYPYAAERAAQKTPSRSSHLIACLLVMCTFSQAESNLCMHVDFEEGATAAYARGASAPVVSERVALVEGKVGKGIRMGPGSRLAYAAEGHINPGSGTIMLWVKPSATALQSSRSLSIVDCGNTNNDNNDIYLAYFPQFRAVGATFDAIGPSAFYEKDTPLEADRWQHLAMTWHCEEGIAVYHDGVPLFTEKVTWAPTPVSDRFTVACGRELDHPVSSVIDEFLIYDRPLSTEEIAAQRVRSEGPLPSVTFAKPYTGPLAAPATEVAEYMSREQVEPLAPLPEIVEVEHIILHYDKKTYCGHPLQVVFKYFGNGEIVVGHNHAPCEYAVETDVRHGPAGYHGRAVQLLQRSTDYGKTWPTENEVVIYEECAPPDVKRDFIFQPDAPREHIDMFAPDSLFFFARTWLPERNGKVICFGLRSADRGRTWEKVPTIIPNPYDAHWDVLKGCYPILRMPDGKTLLAAMAMNMPDAPKHSGPALFQSTDNGLTWEYRGLARGKPRGRTGGRFSYPGLLRMPNGDLHCYYVHIESGYVVQSVRNAICLSVSEDEGATWTDPVPIVGKGQGEWKNPAKPGPDGTYESPCYRAPWPVHLKDGRILVLFNRRRFPMGIGAVLSSDGGRSWSPEFPVRDDGAGSDQGYPVACQFEDGRVFVAYYYLMPDGNKFGGTRYMAATTFRIR